MKHKLSGLDLNGWHDYCVRNWSEFLDEEFYEEPISIDGGYLSQVIWSGDDGNLVPRGGPEAIDAPHGRGNGWGLIGSPDRRISVCQLLDLTAGSNGFQDHQVHALSAPMTALARKGDGIVIAVPDNDKSSEQARERILASAQSARLRRPLLVWRPILLCLQAIETGLVNKPGLTVATISPSSNGVELQVLTVKCEHKFGKDYLAPERKQTGRVFNTDLSYQALLGAVTDHLVSRNNADDEEIIKHQSRLPFAMLRGESDGEEILRRTNGDWCKVTLPDCIFLPSLSNLDQELFSKLVGVDLILLEASPFPFLNTHLAKQLGRCNSPLVSLKADACAKGAWHAAKRYVTGTPIYFDFLPQVEVMILEGREPQFRKLVPASDTVRANDIYRTENPPHFSWPVGQTELELYLKKEGSGEIRRWDTPSPSIPPKDCDVILTLEQQPGQGRARITVSSEEWRELADHPIVLDWDKLELEERSEAELLESLDRPRPGVPERTILQADHRTWFAQSVIGRLRSTLKDFDAQNKDRISDLVNLLRVPHRPDPLKPQSFRLIDSDGNFPTITSIASDKSELAFNSSSHDAQTNALLSQNTTLVDDALKKISSEIDRLASGSTQISNNDLLLASTWAFTKCPLSIQKHLLDALQRENHPLRGKNWKTVIFQGLGRAASTPEIMKPVLVHVLEAEKSDLKSYHLAAIAFFFSRRDTIFDCVDDREKEELVDICCYFLSEGHKSKGKPYQQIYSYALLLSGGLLRFRTRDPYAFLPDECHMGKRLATALELARDGLDRTYESSMDRSFERKLRVTRDLLKVLKGEEAVPNLLRAILDTAT